MRLFRLAGFVVVLCLCLVGDAAAQTICSIGSTPVQYYNSYLDQQPSPQALQELQTIYLALCPPPLGCGNYVLFSNRTAPTVLWTPVGPGYSKFAYNPVLLNQLAIQYGNGASFGILAHALGHHIDFNTTPAWMNDSWSSELRADAWAGCALARTGVGTGQIENALVAIAAFPVPGRPGWPQRQLAVRTGFINCGGQWLGRYGY
jgi:hypothetical protein